MNLNRLGPWMLAGACAMAPAGVHASLVPASVATCTTIPANNVVDIGTSITMSSGQTLLLALGGDSHQLDGLKVRLGTQAFAREAGGSRNNRHQAVTHWFWHRVTANAPVGTTIRLQFAKAIAGTPMCLAAFVLPNIGIAPILASQHAARGEGGDAAFDNLPALNSGRRMAAAWFEGNALPVTSNGSVSAQVCVPGAGPCLVVADLESVVDAAPSISITPASALPWTGAVISLDDPRLFGDGFE